MKARHYDLMAERTRYLKENPEGVDIMCKSMEDMRDRARAEGADKKAMDMARGLHEQGVDVSIIANAAGVAVEIVMKWLGIQPA